MDSGPAESSDGPASVLHFLGQGSPKSSRLDIFFPVFRGLWKETGKKKKIEVAVRKIRKADCQENWMDIIEQHEKGSLDNNNVLKVFGFHEDPDDSWRLVYSSNIYYGRSRKQNQLYSM